VTTGAPPSPAPLLDASWIWLPGADVTAYNQTVIARKTVSLKPGAATLRITADSFYRLFVNGVWVSDGPCRSWPEHFQYDVLDVTSYLREGGNEIEVIARHYGVGDFHRVPKQAGLLAQLEVANEEGETRTFVTDGSWEVAAADAWLAQTPKVSIQMEPAEHYDARREGRAKFTSARVLCAASGGPWKDLNPRDVALMTRQPFALRSFVHAKVVRCDALDFCLPAARLVNPGVIEANQTVSCACGMASLLRLEAPGLVTLQSEGFRCTVAGQESPDGRFSLPAGDHLVLAFVRDVVTHEKEASLRFLDPKRFRLENPLDATHENAWCFLRFPEAAFASDDLIWVHFLRERKEICAAIDRYAKETDDLLRSVKDLAGFENRLRERAELMPSAEMFVLDSTWQTWQRQVLGDGAALVENPSALMHDTPAATRVMPPPEGDLELLYDLGEQSCGYYDFDLVADAGAVVDIVGVEHIAPDGRIQWSYGNRNGLRYVTRQGVNRFTSLKRRSGRYLFVTLRSLKAPVAIRHLRLIESTYPVNAVGSFACSDARLDQIWRISARTLELCMEDTFTDCPLYEQTHWVGDARNESLFAYPVFGATDIGRRCIRQTGQSLERYPIVGCQVPSSWDALLPAWSFLWGISTWDYYWFTGDRDFLREVHPDVVRNLKGAEQLVNDRDLVSGPFWNFFDWTAIDQGPRTVLHNSLLLVGAVDAASKSEEAIGCREHATWLRELRARLVSGVNRLWDPVQQSYPDSIRDDGSISPFTSQHTSALAALYDVVERKNLEAVRRNMLEPPEKLARFGSPFAALYLYEALEKLGLEDEIVAQIYRNYLPMLEAGATTVWESFPSGATGAGGFPTRSHCHAWSSAPLYFLNRIAVGLKPTAPGWESAQISPRPGELRWARGVTATPRGAVKVSWKWTGDTMDITCTAPEGVKVSFASNDALEGKKVVLNGERVQ
jgi:hypothetical protein